MPARSGNDDQWSVGLGECLDSGVVGDDLLDGAAFLVEAIEFDGDGPRFLGVGGGEQAHPEVGFADPAAGVDPRTEREAKIAASRAFDQARRVGQGGEADILSPRHHLQALGHERAVERLELRHVGHRAKRDDVDQIDDFGLGIAVDEASPSAQLAEQGDPEQEGHADRREMAMGRALLAFVEAVGIDHGHRLRQRGRTLMMVADDHVEPGGRGLGQCVERLRTAIDGNRQARALVLEVDQRLAARAIAFHQPIRNVDHRVAAEAAQQQRKHGRRRRSIDIIIAEDRDLLVGLDRVGEPGRRLVHVGEHRRIGQEVPQCRRAMAGKIDSANPASKQQLVDQRDPKLVTALPSRTPWLTAYGAEGSEAAHRPDLGPCRRANKTSTV